MLADSGAPWPENGSAWDKSMPESLGHVWVASKICNFWRGVVEARFDRLANGSCDKRHVSGQFVGSVGFVSNSPQGSAFLDSILCCTCIWLQVQEVLQGTYGRGLGSCQYCGPLFLQELRYHISQNDIGGVLLTLGSIFGPLIFGNSQPS